MEKNKFNKVIAFIFFAVVISASVFLGIGINALNFHIRETLANMNTTSATTAAQSEIIAIPPASNITMETLTVEVQIGTGTGSSGESSDAGSGAETTTVVFESTQDTTTETQVSVATGVTGRFTISNSWEGHYMYDLVVENPGTTPVNSWSITVELPDGCTVSDYWCCKCNLNGNVLTITPEDYNGYIGAGSTITGIGITIASDSNMTDIIGNGDSYVPPELESGTPFSNHGKLSLNGITLVDSKGNPFQLRGVSTHGIGWFPEYVNKDAFKTLRDDWGVNTIRLAMYTAEYNGYCTGGSQADLRQLVENGVEYATDLGMYVIIDWHMLTDCNPNTYKVQAIEFFEAMATKYCNYSNVIYEICNEPNGGVDWNTVKVYADEVIAAIRKYDSDAIILVGTPTWSQDIDQVAANPVANGYNVMYTLHFYAATHRDELRNKLVRALEAGTPAFISEFSICDASGNGGIDYTSAEDWKNLINQYNLSYVGWNLSNKAETSALIKNSCSKLSAWTTEELSDTGKWLRDMISSGVS